VVDWNEDKVSALEAEQVKSLRENAARLGQQKIVELCDIELKKRKPAKLLKSSAINETHSGQYVSEFHFVCPGELGVTTNPDGTKWSGTWVVAEDNAEAAEKFGSIVALHTTKAERSYLQGVVKGWRKSAREPKYSGDQVVKIEFGVDFLLEPSINPLPWRGDATGEKGYGWSNIPS
jgi:hypothetical protein